MVGTRFKRQLETAQKHIGNALVIHAEWGSFLTIRLRYRQGIAEYPLPGNSRLFTADDICQLCQRNGWPPPEKY